MMRWHWLSFCDATQFLGACVVLAPSHIAAVHAAHALGINPGGEVAGVEFPGGFTPQRGWVGRLLTREECAAFSVAHGVVPRRRQSSEERG